ncbi:ABC transporter ATP-binding protein, partial [Actinoplanes sp. NPDC048791]
MSTVALKDVTKVWPDGTVAVDRVSLDVEDGEFMVLLGPSGCGKSTVLRMIAGLEDPSAGAILLNGEPVMDLAPRDRRIAMVFQDFALYPHMTVGDNIGFPLKLSGIEPGPRGERIGDVASALGIGDVLARKPGQLSGGQRQRVA